MGYGPVTIFPAIPGSNLKYKRNSICNLIQLSIVFYLIFT